MSVTAGLGKSKSLQALQEAGLRYITALTDPQIRSLLREKVLQLELFSEEVCEVESQAVRYMLRRNNQEAARIQHRLEDKLAKLEAKVKTRNVLVQTSKRSRPEAGLRQLQAWANRHKLTGLVELKLEGRQLSFDRLEEKITRYMDLAGCYVVTTDIPSASMTAQQVHDSYMDLQNVERDFRTIKTGLLEVRPIFVRKESRTRGHVFCSMLALKLSREMERRLRRRFGTTDTEPYAITLPDALSALASLSLLHFQIDEKITLTKLPKPTANQQQILDALEVKLPAKV